MILCVHWDFGGFYMRVKSPINHEQNFRMGLILSLGYAFIKYLPNRIIIVLMKIVKKGSLFKVLIPVFYCYELMNSMTWKIMSPNVVYMTYCFYPRNSPNIHRYNFSPPSLGNEIWYKLNIKTIFCPSQPAQQFQPS